MPRSPFRYRNGGNYRMPKVVLASRGRQNLAHRGGDRR